MKVASFDVDAQKGFTPICSDELPVPQGDEIVSALNAMAKRATIRVGSKDAHSANAVWIVDNPHEMLKPLPYANADLTWVSHCVPGTKGFELLDGLPKPEEYDFFIWKGIELDMHPYGACYHDLQEKLSTGVIEYLQINQVSTVILGGLALDYCVKNTALQLKKVGFSVFILLEACRALDSQTGQAAITLMEKQGINICTNLEQLDHALGNK